MRTTASETCLGNTHRLEVFADWHSREQDQYNNTDRLPVMLNPLNICNLILLNRVSESSLNTDGPGHQSSSCDS